MRAWNSEAYKAFLRSPEWARKRELVRRRAVANNDGNCERCYHFRYPMAVHHITYNGHTDNPDTPWPHGWDCDPRYLAYLCEDCHDYVHGKHYFDPAQPLSLSELAERIRTFRPKL